MANLRFRTASCDGVLLSFAYMDVRYACESRRQYRLVGTNLEARLEEIPGTLL